MSDLRPAQVAHAKSCDVLGQDRTKAFNELLAGFWMCTGKGEGSGEFRLTVRQLESAVRRALHRAVEFPELSADVDVGLAVVVLQFDGMYSEWS